MTRLPCLLHVRRTILQIKLKIKLYAEYIYIVEDSFSGGIHSVDTQSLLDSVIIKNKSIIRRIHVPTYEVYKTHWRNDSEIQRHYWAAPFLLPIGTLIVLALVIFLMVLFNKCPQMVAAIVASILGIIIIFTSLVSINHTPIYS